MGLISASSVKAVYFFFKTNTKEDCENVMKKGHWLIAKHGLFLKPWTRDFDFNLSQFTTVPTWVKLFNVPYVYWTKKGIGAIASKLGKPLYMDNNTEQASKLWFARVCIEFSLQSTFPRSFKVQSEYGEEFEVQVEYGWIPRKCSACKVFGHNNIDCPNKGIAPQEKKWIPTESKEKEATKNITQVTTQGDSYPYQ